MPIVYMPCAMKRAVNSIQGCDIQETSYHSQTRQRRERERKAKRGEIPNHSSLANPISLLPHGWAIDYDHSRSTTVWRHFWHSPPFPIATKERSTVPSPFPIPHSSTPPPSTLIHVLSSILKLAGLCSGFGATHGTTG